MYLEHLEIHGFKSFAKKTVLEFLPPRGGQMGITAVVGPNGSGKSNVADAIRWVLGEQSMKNLRGKKSEDVIFFGSDKQARLGMAEVSLTLNNADQSVPIDMSQLVITRRLYRDGESEYLVNGATGRLTDIALLLARARFGQKFYTVIGQGLVDSILLATPAERKEFFDEAAGVKEFQLKRAQAVNKIQQTKENLAQAAALVNEIEPRLRSLTRQRRRLEERQTIESELRQLQKEYYGAWWAELAVKLKILSERQTQAAADLKREQAIYDKDLANLASLEKTTTASQAFLDLQRQYLELNTERQKIQEEEFKIKRELFAEEARLGRVGVKIMPVAAIVSELEIICQEEDNILSALVKGQPFNDFQEKLEALFTRSRELLNKIKNPGQNKKDVSQSRTSEQLAELASQTKEINASINQLNQEMQKLNEAEAKNKNQFFDLQRQLQSKQRAVHELEQELNNINIELARLETKRDALENEINLETGPVAAEIKMSIKSLPTSDPSALQPQIFKLKHQLELIGGIDPEAVKEHDEIKERYDFLTSQITDLTKALADTEKGVAELDELMKDKRESALKNINREFDRFFKMVFNGGAAKLTFYYGEEKVIPSEERDPLQDEDNTSIQGEVNKEQLMGVEIQATPPGKRIKDINILSGGERALTAVVLLCAILYNSPAPFVVLDEVDAALDESNSLRFAEILEQLGSRTQFIVITHNRATMTKAQLLYGVTMGADSVSRLLSVKLEEAEKMVNR